MNEKRREFIKKSVSLAALSVGGIGSVVSGTLDTVKSKNTLEAANSLPAKKRSTIRIAIQSSPEPTEENIAFYKQMGSSEVVLWTDERKASAEYYSRRKKLFADHGMNV